MTQQQWFVVRGGKEEGPYTSQQLKQMASSGRLQPNDQVRRADVETVRQANAIKGLFPEQETSPPEVARPGHETDPTAKSGASKKWLVIGSVAMALMVLSCGGLGLLWTVYNKEKQAAHRELAEAEGLWTSGNKAGAAAKYKALLENRSHRATLKGDELAPVYGRLIDFEIEAGHPDEAQRWLAEATERKVTPAVSHPEAKQLFAREEARSRGALLTEEFYPFTPGLKQQTLGRLVLGKITVQSRKEYTHEKSGEISVRWINNIGPQGQTLPLPKPKKLLHRVQDGYVEIGEENESLKKTVWRPILKVGAMAGDSWEREIIPGMMETYKLVRFGEPKFGTKEIKFDGAGQKGKVFAAFIEIRSVTDLGNGKTLVSTEEYELGRGIGPVSKAAFEGEGDGRKLNWTETIAPPLKK